MDRFMMDEDKNMHVYILYKSILSSPFVCDFLLVLIEKACIGVNSEASHISMLPLDIPKNRWCLSPVKQQILPEFKHLVLIA